MSVKSLAQRKLDAKTDGWPWPIDHPNDERALMEGCRPSFERAERVRRFYKRCLRVPREGGGTEPFYLLDWWYRDVIAPLFGWLKPDGRRRFERGFITTAKKSGKSTVLAGLPLYMLAADGEEEAEVYSAATCLDQAKIVYRKTLRSVRQSAGLTRAFRAVESRREILHEPSGSIFRALAADKDGVEGLNPHLIILDEMHVWRDKQFYNALMYGDCIRSQPMFLMITTAGDDASTIGFEEYEFAKELLDPGNDFYSQNHFAYIAEAADKDDWENPASWLQAQPSLRGDVDDLRPRDKDEPPPTPRTIGRVDKLQALASEAKATPRKQRQFIRYICNRWVTESEDTWLDPDEWAACGGVIPSHAGDKAWGGLDLSQTRDTSALCIACWNKDRQDVLDLVWKFWIPKDGILERERQWRAPVRDWVADGWITATVGNVIDYGQIRAEISGAQFGPKGERLREHYHGAVCDEYAVQEIAYDPYNARELCEYQLYDQDGVPMREMRQTYAFINEPSKRFEELVCGRKINHGGNPVAAWMARHVVVRPDASGNIRPDKEKSRQKIDGITAAVMAVGRAIWHRNTRAQGSLFIGG